MLRLENKMNRQLGPESALSISGRSIRAVAAYSAFPMSWPLGYLLYIGGLYKIHCGVYN